MTSEAQRHHVAIDVSGPELVLLRNALLACYEAGELVEPQDFASRLGASRSDAEYLLRRLSGIVHASGF